MYIRTATLTSNVKTVIYEGLLYLKIVRPADYDGGGVGANGREQYREVYNVRKLR